MKNHLWNCFRLKTLVLELNLTKKKVYARRSFFLKVKRKKKFWIKTFFEKNCLITAVFVKKNKSNTSLGFLYRSQNDFQVFFVQKNQNFIAVDCAHLISHDSKHKTFPRKKEYFGNVYVRQKTTKQKWPKKTGKKVSNHRNEKPSLKLFQTKNTSFRSKTNQTKSLRKKIFLLEG